MKYILILLTSCSTILETPVPKNQCAPTMCINESELNWTKHDEDTLSSIKERCKELYERSPCLKKFIKRGFQNYHALCGTK